MATRERSPRLGVRPHRRAILAVIGLLAACDLPLSVRFGDDVERRYDGHDALESQPQLHAPWVRGASVRVFAEPFATAGDDLHLMSSDPAVVAVVPDGDDGERVWARAEAVGAGVAELWLVDDDEVPLAAATVEVRVPTRAVLHAAAPLFLSRDDVPTAVDDVQLVAGGSASFVVESFDGTTRLSGAGGVAVTSASGVVASVSTDLLDERRDWLTLDAEAIGRGTVALASGGVAFASVPVQVVAPEAIAELDMIGSDEAVAREGDTLVLAAQAYDAQRQPLWGARVDWRAPLGLDALLTDLQRYRFAPDATAAVAVELGALATELEIHARTGD